MSLNPLHDIGRSKNSDKPLSTSGSLRRAQTSMRFGATSVIAFLLAAAFGAVAQVSARPAKTSVILITIDTVRADRLGCYGAKDVATPTLDGLARDGVVFERAISQVPLTWPSHAAILTGTYPFQNGVQDFTGQPLGSQFRSCCPSLQTTWLRDGSDRQCFCS